VNRVGRILRVAGTERLGGQLVRYAAVVALGYLLAIAFYTGEVDVGVAPYLALGIVFVLNSLLNFTLLRAWAFPPSGRSVGSDLRRFCVVAAVSAVVNYSSFAVLYSLIGLPATTAQRLGVLIAAPVTFLANRLWSFRTRGASHEPSAGGARAATWAAPSPPRGRLRG
jgi:putative flippase GtrA